MALLDCLHSGQSLHELPHLPTCMCSSIALASRDSGGFKRLNAQWLIGAREDEACGRALPSVMSFCLKVAK